MSAVQDGKALRDNALATKGDTHGEEGQEEQEEGPQGQEEVTVP
jgi:hypothetical protein